jgi:thiamine biosynthesis lipoprotein
MNPSRAATLALAFLAAPLAASQAASCSEVPAPAADAPRASDIPSASDAVALAPSASSAPAAAFEPLRVTLVEKAMGTKIRIQSFTTPAFDQDAIKAKLWKAFQEIQRLEALMTTWQPDSEISRVNAAAGKAAVEVGPESLAVIDKSQWISGLSGGVFDISFEAMHGVWKFDQDLEARIPTKAEIEKQRRLVDYRKITVDDAARTVKLEVPGMRISLGGIAKGYAVDAAAKILEKEGLTAYYVQAGGDLFIRGKKPDGQPFHVGVRDPRGADESDVFGEIDVEDHAFSTAGDYERSFIKDGKRYHHIIDPRTGYPATASRCVTIWAKDAFTADAIDDAVFILGPEKGLALVESLDGVGAVIVDKDDKVWVSKRLEGRFHQFHPPKDGI